MSEALGPRLDPALVEQGVEKECPFAKGLYVTILPAASWNSRWKERVRQENDRVLARMRDGEQKGRADFFGDPDFIAGTLIADMRGIYDADGEEVPYTHDLGVRIMTDPANADVREWVVIQAQRYGQFYAEEVEKDLGNSGGGSSGKQAGAGKSKKTKS